MAEESDGEGEDRNLKVTIETHMPPGINGRNASVHEDRTKPQHTFYNQAYLWPFLNLLASCRDLIDAEFTGHTHMDDFRLVEDRGGKPVFFAHITPAVSPVHHNNPGFQVMLYDRKDGTYQDLATYELPLAGKGDPTVPSWKLEYSFRDAYGAKAYNFASLQALEGAIEQDPQVRAKYIQYVTVSCTDAPPATMDDWKFFSCAHLNLDPQSYMDCYR